ncbi:MAG TPA: hypothetical protein VK205_10755 [Prolixibacteraceae bacterium]|nr:hypothetical protein [Prolixibacteraceae bacterium]
MKKLLLILITLLIIGACKKDSDTSDPAIKEYLGKWKRHVTGNYYGPFLQEMAFEVTYEIEITEDSLSYHEDYYEVEVADSTKNNRYITDLAGMYIIKADNKLISVDVTSATLNGEPRNSMKGQHFYLFKKLSEDSVSFIDCEKWTRLTGSKDALLNSSFYSVHKSSSVSHYDHFKREFSNDSIDFDYVTTFNSEIPDWNTPPPYDSRVEVHEDYFTVCDWGNLEYSYLIHNGYLYCGSYGQNYGKAQ